MLRELATKADFIQHIQNQQHQFTPTYRKLAEYLLQNFSDFAFIKTQQWAKAAETSEVSVTRFVRLLGFSGVPEFNDKMQQIIRKELTMTDYFSADLKNSKNHQSLLYQIIQAEKRNLDELLQKYKPDSVAAVSKEIYEAPRIIVIGTRSSAPLAEYCDYMFIRTLGKDALVLQDCGYQTYDSLIPWLDKSPLVLAFAFPRYPKQTIEVVSFLKDHGARIIGITNDELSPLVPLSDHVLYAPAHSLSFTDSFSSGMVLINLLVTEIVTQHPELADTVIATFEKIAKDNDYYFYK